MSSSSDSFGPWTKTLNNKKNQLTIIICHDGVETWEINISRKKLDRFEFDFMHCDDYDGIMDDLIGIVNSKEQLLKDIKAKTKDELGLNLKSVKKNEQDKKERTAFLNAIITDIKSYLSI